MSRILVGSPIRRNKEILSQFLLAMESVSKAENEITYFFVDDNIDSQSSDLLYNFKERVIGKADVIIIDSSELLSKEGLSVNGTTGYWSAFALSKVAIFKDEMIKYCIDHKFDYLFLIDSDIIINDHTIPHLLTRNVEIVSNVFWAKFHSDRSAVPQCFWIPDPYKQYKAFNVELSFQEANQKRLDMYTTARVPGLYKVDGLGACTLIKRSALEKGVCFKKIPNLSIPGEDRDFCIRAGVLGIDLYLDTVYPVFHVTFVEDIPLIEQYKKEGFKYEMCRSYNKKINDTDLNNGKCNGNTSFGIIGAYSRRIFNHFKNNKLKKERAAQAAFKLANRRTDNSKIVLKFDFGVSDPILAMRSIISAKEIADEFVFLYDSNSKDVLSDCICALDGKEAHAFYYEPSCGISRGSVLWEEASRLSPGWIFSLDPGEILEEKAASIIKILIDNNDIDAFMFRRYKMLGDNEYIDDSCLDINEKFRPYLMRFQQAYKYVWDEDADSRRFPYDVYADKYANIEVKIKDFGYLCNEGKNVDLSTCVVKDYKDLPDEMLV